jgi:hypothetical protein
MRVGLLDIDGHNFPNLALMKISAYHRASGDSVEWVDHFRQYDKVFLSKVFTFSQDNEFYIDSPIILKGGTGYDALITLPPDIDKILPDYSLYPSFKSAYGFITRGCPNNCSWCVVPRKEGNIHPYSDIEEILQGRNSAILMDNNILASDYGIRQIEKIIRLKVKVDFNQGLDARRIDRPMAKLLAQVKWLSPLRMACDTDNMLPIVIRATGLLREYGCKPSNYFIYLLVKDIESAIMRAETLKEFKLDPFAQPYRDFTTNKEPSKEQKQFARWVNHKAIFKSVKWQDYR